LTGREDSLNQLLDHIRHLDGVPGPQLKAKIYCAYRDGPKEPDWDLYPSWSFHPTYISASVQSELVVFDGSAMELLRMAPGWKQSKEQRPELFRSLLVPQSCGLTARLLEGISNRYLLPGNLSETELVRWLEETFQDQSFQRILNLSTTPEGTWLADLIRGVVDSERTEGLFFSGVKPTVKSGPATYLYFRCRKQNRRLPLRPGPFHALLSALTNYPSNQGVSPPESDMQKASDFREGMHHPDRPLVVLAPPSDPGELSIRGWAQFARHLIDEEQREVAVIFDQTEGELKNSMDRETGGRVPFVNRWLTKPSQRASLLTHAEAVVSANPFSSLLCVRLEIPVLHGGRAMNDLFGAGDLRLVLDNPFPEPESLAGFYHMLGKTSAPVPELPPGGRVERELEGAEPFQAIPRTTPPLEQKSKHVKRFIFEHAKYRLCYVLINLVGDKIPSIPTSSISDRYQLRFGDDINRNLVNNVVKSLRNSLSNLESRITPEIDGIDPTPPTNLGEEEQQWFDIFQPLWAFRIAATGDKEQGKIGWGVRYFFTGCRSTLQKLESS